MMALDDKEDRDYTRHFHPSWRWGSIHELYEPLMTCFLVNDLKPTNDCIPSKSVVKKGWGHVRRMQSDMQINASFQPTKDEYIDEDKNLVRVYSIEDDVDLVAPMTLPAIVGRQQNNRVGQTRGCGT